MIRVADLPAGHPGRRLLTGRTMFFAAPSEQRCSYCLYVPAQWAPETKLPVLVAVHGTGRRPEQLREALVPFADEHGVIVVAPLFPAGIGDPDDVHAYKFLDGHGVRYDLVLLDIVEQVGHRWNARVDRIMLYGHSGGGQFAHRFLYLHPGRLAAVAISAPGRVTLLDDTLPWFTGVADTRSRFGIEVDPRAIARVPVLLTIGAEDDGIADLTVVSDDGGRQPGTTRRERLDRLADSFTAHGVPWTQAVIPGGGHDTAATLPAVTRFLADALSRSEEPAAEPARGR
ncbi:poly(3-hydroxybutyrate) depolymerase [Thermocatellispora tengchongensis]|uniref:Poly(3-hydroxybutyrate) depolymerase n=1 Tax=Thermocatellispora tengchongensis TaxID=1073253 RepID=A0A840P3H1_9ACTN|nr:alpha/beta hydrolase [Thermocatellispora tengchongensis]MBB5132411.1 poly(3-hydroxybutyrate) depolymerase [Thermocatellispora tengchongensis]